MLPSALTDPDRPSLAERSLVRRPLHLAALAGAVGAGVSAGLTPMWVVVTAALAMMAPRLVMQALFSSHFRRGNYRRALYLASNLLRTSWLGRTRTIWQLNKATCYIVLGDLEKGKQLALEVQQRDLPGYAGWVLRVNLAALYLKMGQTDEALIVLAGFEERSLPRAAHPYFYINRAAARTLRGEYDAAVQDMQKVEAGSPRDAVMASALSLRAYIAMEKDGDVRAALELSRQAVQRLGDEQRVQPQVVVTHARIILEGTGDERACLDALAPVMPYEMEMGLITRAELYFLLAVCFQGCGLPADARSYLLRAGELPCTVSLKSRIGSFVSRLAGRPGPGHQVAGR